MDEKRDIVSKAILLASLRLTHDHELGFYEEKDLLQLINIDYTNELARLFLYKFNNKINLDEEIDLYIKNKEKIIENRLKRVKQKKKRINNRKEKDWVKVEEEYRNEEIEHLNILLNFTPNKNITGLRRANYNDIRLIRNYIRTINNCNGLLHDDNKINKYRNLEITINNADYIIIEVIDSNYGYIVDKRDWTNHQIIKILDDKLNIKFINDNSLFNKFLIKIQ